jgi:hypothetical protein
MDWLSIFFIFVISVLGVAMTWIGIEFYDKCKKGESLRKSNYQWLVYMRYGFAIFIVVAVVMAIFEYRATN